MGFRFRKSVPLPYERQGYIYYKSLCFKRLSKREKDRLIKLCSDAGGAYSAALFEYMTSAATADAVCLRHYISRSTLERAVRKYYIKFPRWM